ncbi:MAG: AAA family ATPase, partial [Phycicoccus sp.]
MPRRRRSALALSDVIGRRALINRCARHLNVRRDGRDLTKGVLLLVGEAGIGKTVVLNAVGQASSDTGKEPLRLEGHQAEWRIPYGGLTHLLAACGAEWEGLPKPARLPLAQAIGDAAGDVHLLSVGRALASLLERLGRPLLVDDVHWLDPATRSAVVFALRVCGTLPAIATARPGEVVGQLARAWTVVEMGGLTNEQLQAIVEQQSPLTATQAAECCTLAKGNPFHALEIARALEDSRVLGDLEINSVLADRVRQLSANTQLALGALALSMGEHLPSVLRMLNLTDQVLAPERVSGIVVDGHFIHPLFQAAVVACVSVDDQVRIRTALADQAQAQGDADRATWHLSYAMTTPSDDLANQLDALANQAWRRGAVEEARLAWERASELHPTPERRRAATVRAAHKAWLMGDLAGSTRLLARARGPTDAALHALEELTRGQLELWATSPLDALARFERAHREAADGLRGAAAPSRDRLRLCLATLSRCMVVTALLTTDAARARGVVDQVLTAISSPAERESSFELKAADAMVELLAQPGAGSRDAIRSMFDSVPTNSSEPTSDQILSGADGSLQVACLGAMLIEEWGQAEQLAHLAALNAKQAGMVGFASLARTLLAELHWRRGRAASAAAMLEPIVTEPTAPFVRCLGAGILARVLSNRLGCGTRSR